MFAAKENDEDRSAGKSEKRGVTGGSPTIRPSTHLARYLYGVEQQQFPLQRG